MFRCNCLLVLVCNDLLVLFLCTFALNPKPDYSLVRM